MISKNLVFSILGLLLIFGTALFGAWSTFIGALGLFVGVLLVVYFGARYLNKYD